MTVASVLLLLWLGADLPLNVRQARDTQDRSALQRIASDLAAKAGKQANDPEEIGRASCRERV